MSRTLTGMIPSVNPRDGGIATIYPEFCNQHRSSSCRRRRRRNNGMNKGAVPPASTITASPVPGSEAGRVRSPVNCRMHPRDGPGSARSGALPAPVVSRLAGSPQPARPGSRPPARSGDTDSRSLSTYVRIGFHRQGRISRDDEDAIHRRPALRNVPFENHGVDVASRTQQKL
jgi:hypothetical protein